tara:strand:- start:458 stop:742 length:285 start_codon:yes stop_codon:yes gene_type:complete
MEIKIVSSRKFNSKKFINSFLKKTICNKFIKGNDKQLEIRDPKAPEYVLLGLILVSFLPLSILPKIYPPISDKKVDAKIQKRIIKEYSVSPLNK